LLIIKTRGNTITILYILGEHLIKNNGHINLKCCQKDDIVAQNKGVFDWTILQYYGTYR
jgi:hypothetical protein